MSIRIWIEIKHDIARTPAVKDVVIPVIPCAADSFTEQAFFVFLTRFSLQNIPQSPGCPDYFQLPYLTVNPFDLR